MTPKWSPLTSMLCRPLIEFAPLITGASWIRTLGTIVFALVLPVFLITSAVRTVTLSESFYLREFAKYRIAEVTGLSEQELVRVADVFISYFQSRPTRLELQVPGRQGLTSLFNDRELQHMVDVQIIMQRVLQATWIALGALALSALVIIAADFGTGILALLWAIGAGGLVTAALVGLIALGSLLDFNRLFLLFHFVSFSNDLWLLDPRTDHLIQLFPQGFFYDAALQIGFRSAGIGAAMAAVALIGLRILK